MFILTYIILSFVNNTAEVPEWILATVGLVAILEGAWWVFMIVVMIISAIIESVKK